MNIDQLLSALTHGTIGLPPVDEQYCASHEIEYRDPKLEFYVCPELVGPEPTTPLVLISAPAAVGKTTLARYVHSELAKRGQGTIYVPLQRANIGEDFFTGRLSSVFRSLSKEEFLNAVFGGQIVILFDGYDEVTMRSDQIERNREFLAEILEELRSYRQSGRPVRTSIVFLFRSVFAESGIFDNLGEDASAISVSFFDPIRRKKFLAEYLDSRASKEPGAGPSKAHLAAAFLDGFETILARARDEAAAFFGHAIVLSAFGDFLHEQEEQNAAVLASQLTRSEWVEATSVTLLSRIINNILDREVIKFPNHEYEKRLKDFVGYTRNIQERLLCAVAEDDLLCRVGRTFQAKDNTIAALVAELGNFEHFDQMDEAARNEFMRDYTAELSLRLNQHPFLDLAIDGSLVFRNPVYREYYLAQRVSSSAKGDWDALTRANDASHYLALFFLHNVPNRDLTDHETFLFHLVSLLASSSFGDDFLFKLVWDTNRQQWLGTVESKYLTIEPFSFSSPFLSLRIPARGVLQNAALLGDHTCVIEVVGPGLEDKEKTPISLRQCTLAAGEIEISSSAVDFDAVALRTSVLHIKGVVQSLEGLQLLDLRPLRGDSVTVQASEFIRKRYGGLLTPSSPRDDAGYWLFQHKLEKLLLWFRRHKRAEYGCYDKKFDNCALNNKQDQAATALAEFLFHEGMLRKDGSIVIMDQAKFAQADIFYGKQNELHFGDKSKTLHNDLVLSPFGSLFA